jgi:hypothetical protein
MCAISHDRAVRREAYRWSGLVRCQQPGQSTRKQQVANMCVHTPVPIHLCIHPALVTASVFLLCSLSVMYHIRCPAAGGQEQVSAPTAAGRPT